MMSPLPAYGCAGEVRPLGQPKSQLVAAVTALAPRLQAWAQALVAPDAEGGAPLVSALGAAGFALQRSELPGVFVADWRGAAAGPRLVLLAEYDADETCRHHLTGAALTGAALAVASLGSGLPGTLRVIGTPARPGDRLRLLTAGLLDGAAAALLAHPGERWQAAIATLALQPLTLVFTGRGAHAGLAPEQGINALDACIGFFNAVAALRQQLPPLHRVHGVITDGGGVPDRVPERAAAAVCLRAPDAASLAALAERVSACGRGAAAAAGAQVEITPGAPALAAFTGSAPLAAAFARNLQAIGAGPIMPPAPPAGASDAGNLSAALPCLCAVFPPAELVTVAKAMALTLFDLFAQSELLAESVT